MKTKSNLLFIAVLYFFSCSNPENDNNIKSNHLEFVRNYEFKVGMSIRRKHSGIYYDKEEKQEYMYFGNVVTDKVIKLFSFENGLVRKIPLDKVTNEENIEDFSIISLDTIIVLSQYTNKLFFINREGDIWKKIALDSLIIHPTKDYYEFSTSPYSEINIDNSRIILGADWREKDQKPDYKTQLEEIKDFYYNLWKSDRYLRINIDANGINDYRFGCSLYNTFFPDDSIVDFIELDNYYIANNDIFVWSDYSNKIMILNSDSLTIKKTIKIESKLSPIGANLIPINEKTVTKLQELTLKNARTSGIITRIFYDSHNNIYYFVMLKQISYDFFEKYKYRPSILMIFDKEFNKIEEFNITRDQKGFIFSSNKGLLLNKIDDSKSENIKYSDQRITLSLYKYYE